jgi:UDP-N-acetylglucosamine 2-epimerase (non-hydrolysing)
MPATYCYVVGTRPNFVKIAPLLIAMRRMAPASRHVLVHTGQHYDDVMSDVFLEQLGVGPPDRYLSVGSGPHGAQTARVLEGVENHLLDDPPDVVIVPGDVNSTLAAALAAAKLLIPIAHIEAGLRSFDRTMPEEINRVLTDQVSRWLFTHSPEAATNLEREGADPARIHFVGNTMIDTLVALRPTAARLDAPRRLNLGARPYLLVTLHRPALVDGPLLFQALHWLAELSSTMDVVFPVHPRTRAAIDRNGGPPPGIRLARPLGYLDFLGLQMKAAGVLTDSGGVQEETTMLGVPCFTLRDNTERPVTVTHGTNRLLGLEPARIQDIPGALAEPMPKRRMPRGWDGHAGKRIANVLIADVERDQALRRS